jgi:hypothetical protein
MHAELYRKNLKERERFDDLVLDGRITLEWILKE